jgi:glutamine phosphoribosylpyrophosphate amidotransferase
MAAISERGSDAAGYCYRGPDVELAIHKQRSGASRLLDSIRVPGHARQALVHVRDYTKGHPSLEANNHPIRHGSVIGIHNGIIRNDEEIFAEYGFERAAPMMTVDSEAIFALMEIRSHHPRALSELRGAMAAAWLDERDGETMYLARGLFRPLWLGGTRDGLYFASTRRALTIVAAALKTKLDVSEVREGRLLHVVAGSVVRQRRFRPDRSYREDSAPPPVRAPREAVSCLERLAALTSAGAA